MLDSGPAVVAKAASNASTTARARRRCAKLGDKFERRKCCSSGTAAAVFAIGATPQRVERTEPILFRVAALHMIPPGSQLTHSATWSGRGQQTRAHHWRGRPGLKSHYP